MLCSASYQRARLGKGVGAGSVARGSKRCGQSKTCGIRKRRGSAAVEHEGGDSAVEGPRSAEDRLWRRAMAKGDGNGRSPSVA